MIYEPLFILAPFSRKSILMSFFMLPKVCQHDLLYLAATSTFSLPDSQCAFTPWTFCLTPAHSGKQMFSPFANIIQTKSCFFVYISHFSVNFIWFALLTHQKFDDNSLQAWRTLICHHFELPQ